MADNKIGTMIGFSGLDGLRAQFERLRAAGMEVCQLGVWGEANKTAANAAGVKALESEYGVTVSAVWAGWDGPAMWNFYDGPKTIGIVPPQYREARLKRLFTGADFAAELGVSDVITHVGFLPENPNDPDFAGTVAALKKLAGHLKASGQYFLFETGQETPVTLLRAIEEIGMDNLGVNLDTANLILYGKACTLDALDVIGRYVRNTHCKDGFYPENGRELGREVPLGQGKADIRAVIRRLIGLGYRGPFVIEREISGEEQNADILAARDLIRSELASL